MPAPHEVSIDGASQVHAVAVDEPDPCCQPLSTSDGGRACSRRDLNASLGDGAAYSVMVGIGEYYLPAFVLALGMGEIAAGLMATVPMLGGALLQLASPWAVRRVRSYRRWVVACAAAQAASLLILPLVSLAGAGWGWLAFLAAILYWAAGLATGPAWSTWMEELVPARVRARFLARRSRFYHVGMMAGFLLGGVALQAGAVTGRPLLAFAGLFAVAAASRLASVGFLTSQGEGHSAATRDWQAPSARLSPEVKRSFVRLLAYLLAIQAAVYTSGPYFTPYMLSELKLSYLQYATLMALGFLGKAILLPLWGRLAHRTGARRLLWIGGIGIVPASALWMVSDHMGYLIALQLAAGVVWAAYELAILLMFFEAIPKQERLRLLTIYNVGNAAAMVAGSLLGAAVLYGMGGTRAAYFTLFAFSSVARAVSLLLLGQVPNLRARSPSLISSPITAGPATPAVEPSLLPSLPPSSLPATAEQQPLGDAA